MGTTIFSDRRLMDAPIHADTSDEDVSARLTGIEIELKTMRDELEQFRKVYLDRERKSAMLMDAYKEVLSDLTQLFEVQRQENTKREESLRFFLGSIEGRMNGDFRQKLGIDGDEDTTGGWWPFRRTR